MAFYYAAGRYANLLERAASITLNPSVDSNFPAANLFDARPSRVARHGSNAANPSITWDGNGIAGGSPHTMNVRAGERRRVNSTSGSVTIRNLATGKYLTSGAAWQSGSTTCLSGAGSLNYQIESLALCQSPVVPLTITYTTAQDWPQWNACVIYGHNLDPGLTIELRSSTDNFSGSNVLEVTGAIKQPSFYMIDTGGITNRYGRVIMTGTNQTAPWYAEVFPCWLETSIAMHAGAGYEIKRRENQIRNDGRWGVTNAYNLSPYPVRVLKLSFRANLAGSAELQGIEWMCRGGLYPIVAAPMTTEAEVLYGRLSSDWSDRRVFSTLWETDLIIAEEPIAVPLA